MAASTIEPPVGASTCASGNQVCTGHIGTLTAKATRKARKIQICGPSDRQLVPVENREAATRLDEQVDQREQEEQRTEQGIEEELERRINPVRAAPDADDQVQRDQRSFEEDIEQHAVERREDAVHQAGHDQEGGVVLRDLCSITFQPASTTMIVMKLLRMTNSIEMPSTPRW
jgi:hypothetical protein